MNVLIVSAPLFTLVLLGYIATRLKLMPLTALPGLNAYVLYFAMTAMLFRLGATNPISEMFNVSLMGVWMTGAWTVLALGLIPGLKSGLGWRNASFGGLASSSPNLGFMGIPLVSALVSQEALGALMPVLIIDIILLQSTVLALSQHGSAEPGSALEQVKASGRGIVANPLLWAMVFGACWGATGWTMAGPARETISLLADSATPVALFAIGAVLAREQIAVTGIERSGIKAYIGWLTALKLLALPGLMWLICQAAITLGIPVSGDAMTVLVLLAALPTAANTSILAERFKADNAVVASVILASTAGGFITFNVIAALVA